MVYALGAASRDGAALAHVNRPSSPGAYAQRFCGAGSSPVFQGSTASSFTHTVTHT